MTKGGAVLDTMVNVRTGFVYVLQRADLMLCYVGQSICDKRPYSHLKSGNYRYDALCSDGIIADIVIAESDVLQGENLDAAERYWMKKMTETGWTLVNRMGPDDVWPHVPREISIEVGKIVGSLRAANIHAQRKINPDFDVWWSSVARAGNKAMRVRRATDPELDARCKEAEIRGSLRGVEVRRLKRATDSAWAAREKENARKGGLTGGKNGGLKTGAIRRKCLDCDMPPTTPGAMWHHLKASGHIGYETLLNPLPNSHISEDE